MQAKVAHRRPQVDVFGKGVGAVNLCSVWRNLLLCEFMYTLPEQLGRIILP